MSNENDALSERFLYVRKYLSLTQKAFAEAVGVSGGYISLVEGGKRKASVEMLLGVARNFPQISRGWLLTGEGEMLRPSSMSATTIQPKHPGGLRAALLAEGRATEEALSLGEIATLARLGTAGGAWAVMSALLKAHPQGLFLEDLIVTLGEERSRVEAHIALLVKQGSVEELDEGKYRLCLTPETDYVRSHTSPDLQQVVLTSASLLVNRIYPALERKHGSLSIIEGQTGQGQGAALIKDLGETLRARAKAAGQAPGEAEAFTVILAIASEPDP